MDFPTIKCQLGLGASALAASPTWTDVGDYVMSAQIDRGRQYELSDFEAGTMELQLLNNDSRFDPGYSGSPYAPNLQPHTPIRFAATYGGTTYQLFRGFVERWETTRQGRYQSYAHVTATDALALFANYRFPRVDDGNGGGAGRKELGVYDLHGNTWTQELSFSGTDEATRVYALAEATYLTGAADAGPFTEDITLKVTYTNGNGTSGRVGYIRFHNNVVSKHPSSKFTETLNLQLAGNDTIHSIQKVEWKSGKFHGSTLKVHFWGERPIVPRGTGDVQLKAILARCGWPSSMVTIRHAGRFSQTPSSPWDGTLLDAIRQIVQTEIGAVYVDVNGKVVFEDRDYRINNWPASPVHWGDLPILATRVYALAAPSLDNEYVVNRWEITRQALGPNDNPQPQIAVSPSSQSSYGTLVGQRTVTLTTDALAKRQAKYLLARTSIARYRIPSLQIKPRSSQGGGPAVMFPAVLGMELSDPLYVDQNVPTSPSTTSNFVNGFNIDHISHTVTPDDWQTDLVLSPRVTTAFPGS